MLLQVVLQRNGVILLFYREGTPLSVTVLCVWICLSFGIDSTKCLGIDRSCSMLYFLIAHLYS